VVEILARLGKETGEGPPEEAMNLEDPVLPEWRAGRLSIGYEEERDLILLEAEELVPDDEDDAGEEEAPEEAEEAEEPLLGSLRIGPLWDAEEEIESPEAESGLEEDEEAAELEAGWDEASVVDELEADLPERGRVRFWATREQMLSLARHGASVCAQGRPLCQLCRQPLDPEGHVCPALNGHRKAEP
jgi:hypothetical protein